MSKTGTLGDAVRKHRAKLGLTVREYGARFAMSPATVNRVEMGHMPSVSTLSLVSIAMRVPVADCVRMLGFGGGLRELVDRAEATRQARAAAGY